ncbi:hypothetical protein B0H14DRAFT_2901544 [Mycena olivaceomarginata]|nr:hypothetical protein B0H14DRAFT_2901544 [Mycena olivaceomarginata]
MSLKNISSCVGTPSLPSIFAFFVPDAFETLDTSMQYEEQVQGELARVANADLLRIAQVCPRWHKLAMETPSLWSSIGLHLKLWRDVRSRGRMVTVLESSLERGGNFPLDLGINIRGLSGPNALWLIPLLTQYSRRWRALSLSMDLATASHYEPTSFGMLSTIQGRLPLLETLHLNMQHLPETIVEGVASYFAATPRLTRIQYYGRLAAFSKLPLKQLELFAYFDVRPQDLNGLISTMSRFSKAKCDCQIRVSVADGDFLPAIDLPPVISNVAVLQLCGTRIFEPSQAQSMLTEFITRLTLPSLVTLQIVYHGDQWFPLTWPHREFLALAHRSLFHAHLKHLSLVSVHITEAKLLEALSGLPVLQHLAISDHRCLDERGEEVVLVTNSLLERLTWTTQFTCLVPDLSFLETHTLLQFEDSVYRDLVLSRLKPGRNAEGPFEVNLWWYEEYYREVDPVLVAQFTELRLQGELLFLIDESYAFPTWHHDLPSL